MSLTQTTFNKRRAIAIAAIVTFVLLVFGARNIVAAPAAPKAPANLKQTSAFGAYAKVSWDAVEGTGVKYQIDVSQDKVKWATLATVGNTYYTVSKMQTGGTYYLRVRAVIGTTSGIYTEPFQVITQPGYVSELKQTALKEKSVSVSWAAATGAGAYDVYVGTDDSNMKYNQTVKTTKATITGLKKNKSYLVKVVPFNIAPSGYRANGFEKALENVRTTPGKVSGLAVKAWNYGGTNISVEWTAKEGVDGYQVKFYNAAKKCKKTINTTNTTATFTKAAANTFYKVVVRPYVTVNGKKKYGAWNKTPAYAVSQPQMTAFTQAPGKLTIAWNPVEGATSYSIYLTTTNPNYPSSYLKVATVDKSVGKYELTKLAAKDITVLENYYGYVVAEKKVGSKTYVSKVTQAWYCSNN